MKKEKNKNLKISNIGYLLIRPLLWVFVMIFFRIKIYHKENVPKKEGFIFAGTHLSYLDAFVVGKATPRAVHFLAKKELFDNKILGCVLRFMGIISVDRKNKNPQVRDLSINALKDDKVLCIFPEGTCNKSKDDLLPFKYGAVSYAYKSQKPIVPFAIVNKPKIFSKNIKLIIGKPYYVKSDDLEKENEILKNKVLELIKEGRSYEKSQRK